MNDGSRKTGNNRSLVDIEKDSGRNINDKIT